jgi:hypothetical protein
MKGFFLFPSTFSAKSFLHGFPQKVFNGVFELPVLRNAQKIMAACQQVEIVLPAGAKSKPFPNFPQRGTPLISGLLFRSGFNAGRIKPGSSNAAF